MTEYTNYEKALMEGGHAPNLLEKNNNMVLLTV